MICFDNEITINVRQKQDNYETDATFVAIRRISTLSCTCIRKLRRVDMLYNTYGLNIVASIQY